MIAGQLWDNSLGSVGKVIFWQITDSILACGQWITVLQPPRRAVLSSGLSKKQTRFHKSQLASVALTVLISSDIVEMQSW